MKYRGVLFDMDGVIVDAEPLHMVASNHIVGQFGHRISAEQYNAHFAGRTVADGFRLYYESRDKPLPIKMDELLKRKTVIYHQLAKGKLKPFAGVLEFIKSLAADKKLKLALVTSSDRADMEIVLDAFGISDYFDAVITADDITKGKPYPECYLKGAAAVGAKPNACVVIEDAPAGIAAAHSAGMKCVAVLNTYSRDELTDADLIVEKLEPGCLDGLD